MTTVTFRSLPKGARFRLKGGRTVYVKVNEAFAKREANNKREAIFPGAIVEVVE